MFAISMPISRSYIVLQNLTFTIKFLKQFDYENNFLVVYKFKKYIQKVRIIPFVFRFVFVFE